MSDDMRFALWGIGTGIAGVVTYFIVGVLRAYADYYIGKVKSALADKAVAYALNQTEGTAPGEPVPAEKVGEVIAAAQQFVNDVATPARAASMSDMDKRVLARIEVQPTP